MIAQSDPINISREQKIEVVSTLVAYPLVLKELELTNNLLESCKQINALLTKQLTYKDEQLLLMQQAQDVSTEQIDLLNTQLKQSKKGGWLVPALIGFSGGLVLGVVF